jgi:hypothetical protein
MNDKIINKLIWNLKLYQIKKQISSSVFSNIILNSNYMAVIVEPRKHPILEPVLKNFCNKLGKKWSMTIFYGNNNYNFIKNIIGDNNFIKLIPLGKENLTIKDYNTLLCSEHFWNKLDARKILIFQCDCILRYNLDKFTEYDYIGAPWINGDFLITGNGGLSIRDKEKTLKIIKKYPRNLNSKINEDVYFSQYFSKENYNIASSYNASLFSCESYFSDSCGLHKSYHYLKPKQLKFLLSF